MQRSSTFGTIIALGVLALSGAHAQTDGSPPAGDAPAQGQITSLWNVRWAFCFVCLLEESSAVSLVPPLIFMTPPNVNQRLTCQSTQVVFLILTESYPASLLLPFPFAILSLTLISLLMTISILPSIVHRTGRNLHPVPVSPGSGGPRLVSSSLATSLSSSKRQQRSGQVGIY